VSSRNSKNQTGEKDSFIEKWPETTRKKILIFSVSLITLIIIIGWASNFTNTLDFTQNDESTQEFNELFEQTAEAINQVKQEIDQIKQVSELVSSLPTTSPEISDEDIEKIKEKLLEQQQ